MLLNRIKQYSTLTAIAALALLLVGCDSTESTSDIATCRDLSGSYTATSFTLESVDDPDLVEDFEDSEWSLVFSADDIFTSQFVTADEDPRTLTGTADFVGEDQSQPDDVTDIVFGMEPLVPNVETDIQQRYTCELTDDGFTLETSLMDYDFDGDGTYEEAEHVATFTDLDPAL